MYKTYKTHTFTVKVTVPANIKLRSGEVKDVIEEFLNRNLIKDNDVTVNKQSE